MTYVNNKNMDKYNFKASFSELSGFVYQYKVYSEEKIEAIWANHMHIPEIDLKLNTIEDAGGWKQNIHPEDRKKLDYHKNKIKKGMASTCEYRVIDGSDNIIWLRDELVPSENNTNNKPLLYGVLKDITEYKNITENEKNKLQTIQKAKKLKAMAILSAGISHEINNPLMGIMNYAELLRDKLDNEIYKGFLTEILKESSRIATTVKKLQILSENNPKMISYTLEFEDLFDNVEKVIGKLLKDRGIKVRYNSPENIPTIYGNYTQISQVILNIFHNAIEALGQKDIIGNGEEKEITVNIERFTNQNDEWVCLSIRDNGVGIAEEDIDHIFDPYYTSKSRCYHTGIGLPESLSIILDHNGDISVDSKVDEYTCFKITLPVHKK